MKIIYTLYFGLCLSLLPSLVAAQALLRPSIFFGIGQDHLHLFAETNIKVISSTGSGHSVYNERLSSRKIGFHLGYNHPLRNYRWEIALRANYSGNKVVEFQDQFYSYENLPLERTRTYRTLWMEAVAFWRIRRNPSRASWQIGTGISHLAFQQKYRSGFIYNATLNTYDVIRYVRERGSSLGIPFHLQWQYPINRQFSLGFNAHVNFFFDGNAQSGAILYGVYYW